MEVHISYFRIFINHELHGSQQHNPTSGLGFVQVTTFHVYLGIRVPIDYAKMLIPSKVHQNALEKTKNYNLGGGRGGSQNALAI